MVRFAFSAACLITLAACGGGGGGGDAPPAQPTPPDTAFVWGSGTWGSNRWSASSSPVELAPSVQPSSAATDSELLKTVITR